MYEITSTIRSLSFSATRLIALTALAMFALGLANQARAEEDTIVIVGDSLSSAYGLPIADGWAALLQQRLEQKQLPYRVVNSSITGDTTANGLARLADLLEQHRPAVLILELGGNDGLRGLSIKKLRANLREMVDMASAAGAQVLLVGMQIPVNYGAGYARMFTESFAMIASDTNSSLVPFLLDGFALDQDYFQADGIHPNRLAQPLMLDNVWRQLEPMLQQ